MSYFIKELTDVQVYSPRVFEGVLACCPKSLLAIPFGAVAVGGIAEDGFDFGFQPCFEYVLRNAVTDGPEDLERKARSPRLGGTSK